jgi:hypothetical protein
MRNAISDDFCDDIVMLCFQALPAMNSGELAAFVNTLLALTNRELLRALREARGGLIDGEVCEN